MIIGFLTGYAVYNFGRSREGVYRDMCINNLRQIKLAKSQYALENNKYEGSSCSAADIDSYLEDDVWSESGGSYTSGHKLVCPDDAAEAINSSYNINNLGTDPTCKIDSGEHHL